MTNTPKEPREHDRVFHPPEGDLVLGGNFTAPAYSMFSASGDVTQRLWRRVPNKPNFPDYHEWYVPANGDTTPILYHNRRDVNSRGFGGRTLKIRVVNHLDPDAADAIQEVDLQGPWSGNSAALFEQTGLDYTQMYLTWGCIGKKRSYQGNAGGASRTVIEDLVYFDDQPTRGPFNRIERLAKQLSDEMGVPLAYWETSYGGSTSAVVNYHQGRSSFHLNDTHATNADDRG